jgi:hypothetical protein
VLRREGLTNERAVEANHVMSQSARVNESCSVSIKSAEECRNQYMKELPTSVHQSQGNSSKDLQKFCRVSTLRWGEP